jgi:hypothetical protein
VASQAEEQDSELLVLAVISADLHSAQVEAAAFAAFVVLALIASAHAAESSFETEMARLEASGLLPLEPDAWSASAEMPAWLGKAVGKQMAALAVLDSWRRFG